jgi:hypothetical protein
MSLPLQEGLPASLENYAENDRSQFRNLYYLIDTYLMLTSGFGYNKDLNYSQSKSVSLFTA